MAYSRPWFLLGLFLTTAVTLCLEILTTRLFSVISWYHLSFFAVSTAMFGMSAGALHVYRTSAADPGRAALRALPRWTLAFALSVPLAHLVTLAVPVRNAAGTSTVVALSVLTLAIATPFFLSGVIVTLALTRVPERIGLSYAVDLVGAALGTLLVLPLLEGSNVSSAVLVCAALGALAAASFTRAGGGGSAWSGALLALALGAGAWLNQRATDPLAIWYPKGNAVKFDYDQHWNIHSQVLVSRGQVNRPFYWGPGEGAERFEVVGVPMTIDGGAATTLSRWDGNIESLEWIEYDVTSLPYQLRQGGDAAVIGVGGGRDLLAALRARSRSVTGIEINAVFLELLTGARRAFAGIADRPEVRFVHDEARSYLTRTEQRFDVLQMSLIDTWAATGAGAMTLTENGLYTREAWRVFLGVLKPDGLFSVSRWYHPEKVSETCRLLTLCTAALLDLGVSEPARHVAVVLRGGLATLLVSPTPLSAADVERVHASARRFGFQVLLAPDRPSEHDQIRAIVAARSEAELSAAAAHPRFDYSPPTDERPFFFNLLKPAHALDSLEPEGSKGVVGGNLLATGTLLLLFGISFVLVVLVILAPLARAGLPSMPATSFALSVAYFAAIGMGYMLVQIPTMQRFSIYLGHPTYAVVVILFAMILATGLGSLLSERLAIEEEPRWLVRVPLAVALALGLFLLALQPVIDHTIRLPLAARCAVVVAMVGPVALLLGLCFPLGMRLVRRLSEEALPWMWGVNGASGVFAAVGAVAVSMWWGIHRNLLLALGAYATLALIAPALWRRGRKV
jgi:SAM-dependent methyltransferase